MNNEQVVQRVNDLESFRMILMQESKNIMLRGDEDASTVLLAAEVIIARHVCDTLIAHYRQELVSDKGEGGVMIPFRSRP